MSPLPPSRFVVAGKPWRTRWGDGTHKNFNNQSHHGVCDFETRTIYLDPTLRLKARRREAWEWWTHEWLHAACPGLTHAVIGKMQARLGDWFYENGFRLE